ncbi:MAG: TlyA family RNA methyltransferase, partial [Rhodospirillaceae bacterium]|nr:TlyA family RNA methyltransferase [Rhodospirillaceae bacterium]
DTTAKAQALIMSGVVFHGEQRLSAAGDKVTDDIDITVRRREHPWVSRGGLKLAHGLEYFKFDPRGRVCVDVGCSTGGFTDVLLAHDAAKVYAVDVGYGQLAEKLRKDARVVVMERTNARHLTREMIAEPLNAIVCDASFIGLRTVLPASMALAGDGAFMIALIKPQFEARKDQIGPKGVVRNEAVHAEVCDTVRAWLSAQAGWTVAGITPSPITGPEGNVEFLIGATFAAPVSI